MEPNQNIQDNSFGGAPTTVGGNVAQNESSVTKAPEKKNNGMLIGLILCLLLAIGGIGFGAWTMVDSSSRVESLNGQVKTLQEQNSDLLEQVNELSEELENTGNIGEPWADTEVVDGVFYIKDANGNVIMQSDKNVNVEEIVACDESDDKTVLKCTVNTTDGEGWFLYDVFGDSLSSSFEEE